STNAFLSELRRERAVELAFEGHRFVDLRRWLLLTERPYTLKKAIEFDRGMSNEEVYADPKNARVLNFRQRVIVERKLEQKHYWYPFLRSDVTMYEGFQQHPGRHINLRGNAMKENNKVYTVLFALLIASSLGTHAQETTDSLVHVAFGTKAKTDLLGGVNSVDVSALLDKNYSTFSLDNLESFVGGYNGNIWGQGALILVDGVPRSASDVRLVEIASITVLKGASNVALYGSNGAKGVILITTKRGEEKPLQIDVRANTGLFSPKR